MMDSGHVRIMYGTLSNKSEKQCISLAFIIRKFLFIGVSIKIYDFSYTLKSNNKTLCLVTKHFKHPAFSYHITSFMACNGL